jgi:hypothetical protein
MAQRAICTIWRAAPCNRGTLGDSLAHADPAADRVKLMALLAAQYLLIGPAGARTVDQAHRMDAAFTTALADAEILSAVRIVVLSPDARWSDDEFNRNSGEFAAAIAGFIDEPRGGALRGLIGATDGTPYVIADATPLIDGWDQAFADAHLQAAGRLRMPDSRSSAATCCGATGSQERRQRMNQLQRTELTELTVNGNALKVSIAPRTHLAHFLREQRLLTGTNLGGEQRLCATCTLMIDGVPMRSCSAGCQLLSSCRRADRLRDTLGEASPRCQ